MRRNPFLMFVGIIALLILAYAWREQIYQMLIVPLAYIWWVIRLYYRYVPQVIYWAILIFIVLYTATRTLIIEFSFGKSEKKITKSHEGPVEKLTHLLEKRQMGVYYKWLIANRLGNLAYDVLGQRENFTKEKRTFQLKGRPWNPPANVIGYLEAGLNGSFADHPQSPWFNSQKSTPLDEDPQQIVAYLESETENENHGHRQGI